MLVFKIMCMLIKLKYIKLKVIFFHKYNYCSIWILYFCTLNSEIVYHFIIQSIITIEHDIVLIN